MVTDLTQSQLLHHCVYVVVLNILSTCQYFAAVTMNESITSENNHHCASYNEDSLKDDNNINESHCTSVLSHLVVDNYPFANNQKDNIVNDYDNIKYVEIDPKIGNVVAIMQNNLVLKNENSSISLEVMSAPKVADEKKSFDKPATAPMRFEMNVDLDSKENTAASLSLLETRQEK